MSFESFNQTENKGEFVNVELKAEEIDLGTFEFTYNKDNKDLEAIYQGVLANNLPKWGEAKEEDNGSWVV